VKGVAEMYICSRLGLCGLLWGELYLCHVVGYPIFPDNPVPEKTVFTVAGIQGKVNADIVTVLDFRAYPIASTVIQSQVLLSLHRASSYHQSLLFTNRRTLYQS
jgi:hypothetical protein